ncbi:MAG: hypothetical protein IE910_01120 [Brevundimonas sp.]|nr:hypothetical protein [Brevundimonas sp.]
MSRRQRRRPDRRLAEAFIGNARSFHSMAQTENDPTGGSRAYSWAIAIELALKAYLVQRGITDDWNRIHLQHDLNKALRCARMAGLRAVPDGLRELSGALSPFYASGALSWGQGRPVIPMALEVSDQIVAELLVAVEAAIGVGEGAMDVCE